MFISAAKTAQCWKTLRRLSEDFHGTFVRLSCLFVECFPQERDVSETSQFGFCSSITVGKRFYRSAGLHGAEEPLGTPKGL